MAIAKRGDKVQVHYTGSFTSGEVFDSSKGGDPIGFLIGAGEVIPGFEGAIVGMKVGDVKKVEIPAEEAYGPRLEELMVDIAMEEIPDGVDIVVGAQYQLRHQDGGEFVAIISEVRKDGVTLDANHPLAGETLMFELELVGIE